jgi:hypothetical protein
MKQSVLVALLTVLGFAAGFGARIWTEHGSAMPPPPRVGGEFTAKGGSSEMKKPVDRAELVTEIERLRPQIAAYSARIAELDADFDRSFEALLNPDQREQRLANQKKRAEKAAKDEPKVSADLTPLSDDQIDRLRQRPLYNVLRLISVKPKVEMLATEYKLDAAQQAKLHDALAIRREKFVELLDSTPAPTVRLSALAPVVQKLADPKK